MVTVVARTSGSVRVNPATTATTAGRSAARAGRTLRVSAPARALRSSGVPVAITVPWSMTTISSASWSASSRYWVVSRTVTPLAVSPRTTSHISLRLSGSSPVVGSSR